MCLTMICYAWNIDMGLTRMAMENIKLPTLVYCTIYIAPCDHNGIKQPIEEKIFPESLAFMCCLYAVQQLEYWIENRLLDRTDQINILDNSNEENYTGK